VSRVLVTGATGFIGRQAMPPLVEAGHEVHAVSRAPEQAGGREGTVSTPTPDEVVWHRGDLLEGAAVVGEVEPDLLLHLAWYAEPGAYWTSPENVRWVEASLALLRAFVEAGGARVVVAGTCAEYEWSRAVYPEDAPARPRTLYGAAKHALGSVLAAYGEQVGLSWAWGRVFFLYGPHEAPERFVASLARALLAGERAPMTDGDQVRDFMHVEDVGAAFAAVLGSPVTGAVNVASGQGVSLREVARAIAHQAGRPDLLEVGALPRREGEPPALVADVRRLREEVGFRPRYDLDTGVRQTLEWWRSRLATPR